MLLYTLNACMLDCSEWMPKQYRTGDIRMEHHGVPLKGSAGVN